MEPKRFFAGNSQRAFRMVKESLGSDAIIISNRKYEDGVEIMASHSSVPGSTNNPSVEIPEPRIATDHRWQSDFDTDPGMQHNTGTEFEELRRLMLSELSAIKIGSWEQKDQPKYKLFQYFISLGLHVSLVAKLTTDLDNSCSYEQNKSDILQELAFSVNSCPSFSVPVDELTGIVMLHGLTGAGKTTTISKMAARVVATHGKNDVVLVCADNRRMGAHQQLLGYGKILEIPVLHVRRSSELEEILTALNSKKLVLVDHAGITPDMLGSIEKTPGFQCQFPQVRHYLTVSATTQSAVLNRLLSAEWKSRLEGVIVTKVDEAVQLGEIISCLIQNHSPAAYMSAGLNIQNDLDVFRPDEIIKRAVRLGETEAHSQNDELSDTVKTQLYKQLEFLH